MLSITCTIAPDNYPDRSRWTPMARVEIHREDLELDEPMLVEGLPGVGLVGKIATDHLIERLEMTYYGSLHCHGLPEVAVYEQGDSTVRPPVRLYADEPRNLLVLSSDVPVSPSNAEKFATCVTDWHVENDVLPVFLSGLPMDYEDEPILTGIATGSAGRLLDEIDVAPPTGDGAVTGPTGAMLYETERRAIDGIGFIVQADPNFPDPEAARVVLADAVGPLTDVDVDTEMLLERAEEVAQAKSQLAQQMQQGSDESTSARPLGMYQ